MSQTPTPQSTEILGVKINTSLSLDDVVSLVADYLEKFSSHSVPSVDELVAPSLLCTTNPEFIIDAQNDPEFNNLINKAFLSVPDGLGTVLAVEYVSQIQKWEKAFPFLKKKGIHISFVRSISYLAVGLWLGLTAPLNVKLRNRRITGVALTDALLRLANNKKLNVFMLGGSVRDLHGNRVLGGKDIATEVTEIVQKMYPNTNYIGATSAFSRTMTDDDSTIAYIKECMHQKGANHIDLLFVAYNHVWQEKWISRNAIKIPALISIGIGGTLDYIAGIQKKSPLWASNLGLEWFFRLITQPWRIRRILKAFPFFPVLVYLKSITK